MRDMSHSLDTNRAGSMAEPSPVWGRGRATKMGMLVALQGFTIGHPGSDAPVIVIGPDGKPHRVGGWGQQAMAEVAAALTTLNAASQIQDRAMQGRVFDVVQAMLKPHMAYLEQAAQSTQAAAQ